MLGMGINLPQLAAVGGVRSAAARLRNLLFGAGQQGVMYVSKPIVDGQQVLFQDSAGTTPVTSDGQPVGYIKDLSGNGNHATQATAAAKPLYRTDGTLHWLEGDGVDDFLLTQNIQFGQDWTAFSAFLQSSGAASVASFVDAHTGASGQQAQFLRLNSQKVESIAFNAAGGASGLADTATTTLGTKKVASSRISSANQLLRLDGLGIASGTLTGTPAALNVPIALFSRSSGTQQFFHGRLYGVIVVADEAADFAQPESYLANLVGVTL